MTLLRFANNQNLNNIFAMLDHPFIQDVQKCDNKVTSIVPPTDVIELENSYFLLMDLPGFKKEDIQLSMHEGILTVKCHREAPNDISENNFKYKEREQGSFCRDFSFPEKIESTKIEAKYENGVLELHVPKQPVVSPQRIQIQ